MDLEACGLMIEVLYIWRHLAMSGSTNGPSPLYNNRKWLYTLMLRLLWQQSKGEGGLELLACASTSCRTETRRSPGAGRICILCRESWLYLRAFWPDSCGRVAQKSMVRSDHPTTYTVMEQRPSFSSRLRLPLSGELSLYPAGMCL